MAKELPKQNKSKALNTLLGILLVISVLLKLLIALAKANGI